MPERPRLVKADPVALVQRVPRRHRGLTLQSILYRFLLYITTKSRQSAIDQPAKLNSSLPEGDGAKRATHLRRDTITILFSVILKL